jgi:hypothetical protein
VEKFHSAPLLTPRLSQLLPFKKGPQCLFLALPGHSFRQSASIRATGSCWAVSDPQEALAQTAQFGAEGNRAMRTQPLSLLVALTNQLGNRTEFLSRRRARQLFNRVI